MQTHPDTVRAAVRSGLTTKARLAQLAGVHENSLRNIDSSEWSPTWRVLEKLCESIQQIERERDEAKPEAQP